MEKRIKELEDELKLYKDNLAITHRNLKDVFNNLEDYKRELEHQEAGHINFCKTEFDNLLNSINCLESDILME